MTHRRGFFRMVTAATVAGPLGSMSAGGAVPQNIETQQEAFAQLYDVDRKVINLDAAYYGAMTREVKAHYFDRLDFANRYHSTFLRSAIEGMPREIELDKSRLAIAEMIGAQKDEVTLCGGGTEALYALIANYRPIGKGDAVIYADVDYDEMQYAMEYLARTSGAKLVQFSIPEPHTRANILESYEKVLRENPQAKLLLLTHVSNRNGLVPPVQEIIAMAKKRGVDVILDSAQAVGQMPVDVRQLGADFVGFSLHKWVAAPLGTGAIYIKKDRQNDIEPWFGNRLLKKEDLRSRIPTGTFDIAARLSIPKAIAVQNSIGLDRKFSHLKSLRNYWVDRVRDMPEIERMLPDEKDNHGATSAFRLRGQRTADQARELQNVLLKNYGVLVVSKAGLASGPVMRVTPALFNTTAELDALVNALKAQRNRFA